MIQREVAIALPGVKDPRLKGLLTVSSVELSADRSVAKLYYSVLGAEPGSELDAGLEHAAVRLRQLLGRKLRLKRVPVLRFVRAPEGRLLPDEDPPFAADHDDTGGDSTQ